MIYQQHFFFAYFTIKNMSCRYSLKALILKVIYKGFLNSYVVLYACLTSSRNHYVGNRTRKFQLVHKLQRCFSSHSLFSWKDNLP